MMTNLHNDANHLATRSSGVEWSGIRNIFAMAKHIEGVVSLGIGQPDFDTPEHIRDAAKAGLDDGYTRYPPAAGFEDLREAIARKLRIENEIVVDPYSEIFITIGAMQGIFNTILLLVNPGDHVLLLDPGYDYYSQIRLFGGVPIPITVSESNGFRLNPGDLKKAISKKKKLIILNSPSNPTGALLDDQTIREIAEIAMKNNIFVLSDEPYEKMIYDGKRHVSIGAIEGMKNLTVSVFSFSKTYAMTGWRIGYVTAPRFIISEMEKLMEHMASGVTAVSQRAALAALQGPQDCIGEMLAEYIKRRKALYEGLHEIEDINCRLPEGSFYAFTNISAMNKSSWEFATYLLRQHKVAVVPGSVFGKNGEGYIRLSFAVKETVIKEGLDRIKTCIQELQRAS
jgi:aspartate/methionine/tyrosine aminotransferase